MLQSVVEAVGGLLAIPGESSANISFSLFLLSIGHSHSGSVDLQDQERSVASGKREVSLDLSEGRGSSFSSEDSAAPASKPRAASLDTRLEVSYPGGGNNSPMYPASPRNERRAGGQVRSPNTLSVEEDVPCAPRLHSPVSPVRGISYPPLSPKSLVRSAAIQPPVSRNPPLVKARSGSAMSEAPPGPQITVISDPAEAV